VELRLHNRPGSQPVRSTYLGLRKYRELVVTSRALGCVGNVLQATRAGSYESARGRIAGKG
jgi:hypothetical protein